MKKKMRKILFDSWAAAGAKTWIYILVVLAAGTLLSLTLFFAWGDSIENTFASDIKLTFSYTNDSYVSNHYDDGDPQRDIKSDLIAYAPATNMEIYQNFIKNLNELGSGPEVTYFNYNYVKFFPTDDQSVIQVFGINDQMFCEKEGLQIIDGTGDIRDYQAVVSDQQKVIDKDAEYTSYRNARVGDVITFTDETSEDRDELFKVTVVGIYHSTFKYIASTKTDDDFLNSKGMIVLNSVFEDQLAKHPDLYGKRITSGTRLVGKSNATGVYEEIDEAKYFNNTGTFDYDQLQKDYTDIAPYSSDVTLLPPSINHIVFETDTLEHYVSFREKFYTFGTDENRKMAQIFDSFNKAYPSADLKFQLQTNENYFGSILDSLARIKVFYQFVFLSIYLLVVLSLYSFISYLQYGRARDIFIQYSLGKSQKNIIKYYIRYYSLPGLLASIIACIPGYILAWALSANTAAFSAQRQNEFIRASADQNIITYTGISLFNLSWQRAVLVLAVVLSVMELIILLCTWISTRRVLRGSLINHARGGR